MKKIMGTIAVAVLLGAGFGIGGIGDARAQTVEGPKINWRFSSWGQRRAVTEGMEYIIAETAKRTNGNFQIKMFYGEALSQSKENLDGISVGAFEAAYFCGPYHPAKHKPLNVLDLPFLPLNDLDRMYKVHMTVYEHPAVAAALAKWNAYLFMPNVLPQFEIMGRGKAPKTIDDFKGMRASLPGVIGRALGKVGITLSSLTAAETYTALERGTIDAVAFPYSYTFAAYKVDQISNWVTTNLSMGTIVCPTVINQKHWADLPKQYKDLLLSLRTPAHDKIVNEYKKSDQVNEEKWKKQGMTLIKVPAEQQAEFQKIAGRPIWDEWVAENQAEFDAKGLLDLVLRSATAAN
ncbi:MAG: TRAP transporter substrate-binding protein DctP [Rhodospirillales bacterium]|nr:TRAP transporter substrate-binding protein DctP [Rhodospirillales bacterium]